MNEAIQKCQDCAHKRNGLVSGSDADLWRCAASPKNPKVGGTHKADMQYCETVRWVYPVCPKFTLYVSKWDRLLERLFPKE